MDGNEKVDFTVFPEKGGWYFSFDGKTGTGPFPTQVAAHAGALKVVEEAVADALKASLFGEEA